MEIVEFSEKYRNQVVALWQGCNLIFSRNDPNKDIDRKLKVNPELFLVGLLGGEVVATVMGGYEGHRGWINYLAVSPGQRKKGFGRQIMAAVESRIQEKGCPKINLQVRETNLDVMAFYSAIGYGNDPVISFGKRLEPEV